MTTYKTAKSVEEFVRIVVQVRKDWKLEEVLPWFRGQANAEWSLVPKFYRQEDLSRDIEDNVREEFISRAPALSDINPGNKWDWYFLMQHHGAPTRLLDWTEGALIGLYFAVRESAGLHDAAVWVLDAWKLNQRVVKEDEVVPPGDPGTSKQDSRRYEKWLPDRFAPAKRWPRLPVAIYPGHITRRIGAQRSCFTIHGLEKRGLEQIAKRINTRLMKIKIPSWDAKCILHTLETCGVDETTVFPNLEGLSKVLETRWMKPPEPLPHEKVNTRLGLSKVDKNGAGVFAIRRIREGDPLFSGDIEEMVWIEKSSLPKAPKALRKLYEDFAVIKTVKADEHDDKTLYGCPVNFNRLTISRYLNESSKPNVHWNPASYNFFALRNIEAGEELTVDHSK